MYFLIYRYFVYKIGSSISKGLILLDFLRQQNALRSVNVWDLPLHETNSQ